jgi:hypothetical protein
MRSIKSQARMNDNILEQARALRGIPINPKTEVKAHHAQGARPSGRFNVHLASGSDTHQTLPTVKRPEGRAPAIRSGWQGSLHFGFRG